MTAFKFLPALFLLLIAPAALATEARNLKEEEANRQLVVDFYNKFFNEHEISSGNMLAEDYKQHNPDVPDGREAVVTYFAEFFKTHPQSRAKIIRSAVEGDLVWLHIHATENPQDRGQAVLDIFRVKDGLIVEHWDVIQSVPEKSANDNTMF